MRCLFGGAQVPKSRVLRELPRHRQRPPTFNFAVASKAIQPGQSNFVHSNRCALSWILVVTHIAFEYSLNDIVNVCVAQYDT
jgi:hypothetical protein